MTGAPITVEYSFGVAVSFLIAVLWYWVKGISDGMKDARYERDRMRDALHKVEINYATKEEAAANQHNVMELLNKLDGKMDKLADKLDRKADKT